MSFTYLHMYVTNKMNGYEFYTVKKWTAIRSIRLRALQGNLESFQLHHNEFFIIKHALNQLEKIFLYDDSGSTKLDASFQIQQKFTSSAAI